jgi:predicted ester cyclase
MGDVPSQKAATKDRRAAKTRVGANHLGELARHYRRLAKQCYRLAAVANEAAIPEGFSQIGDLLKKGDLLASHHD